jgi:hypothetical protein
MKMQWSKREAEEYFYNAMCNGLGYISGYGLQMDFDQKQYDAAKEALVQEGSDTCYEDILMEVLRLGGKLTLIDKESDGDMTRSIEIIDVHERVCKTPLRDLLDMHNQEDDASTADMILQTVFFEDIIFG